MAGWRVFFLSIQNMLLKHFSTLQGFYSSFTASMVAATAFYPHHYYSTDEGGRQQLYLRGLKSKSNDYRYLEENDHLSSSRTIGSRSTVSVSTSIHTLAPHDNGLWGVYDPSNLDPIFGPKYRLMSVQVFLVGLTSKHRFVSAMFGVLSYFVLIHMNNLFHYQSVSLYEP